MTDNAKLAYLLSSCHKMSKIVFNKVFDKYSIKNNTINSLAYRKNFELYLTLGELPIFDKKSVNTNKFIIKNINYKFLGNTDISDDVIKKSNNKILNYDELHIFDKKCMNLNKLVLCSISAMIKLYIKSYSYLIIPVILDYGRGENFVHQTLLIIDFTGKIMFYEPYGNYSKYDKDYSKCICSLFSIFKVFFPKNTNVVCDTYHNIYGLDEGIQSIIMKKNNERYEEFNVQYDNIIKKIQFNFPDINYKKYDIPITDDKTVNILNLIQVLNKYDKVHKSKKTEFNIIYDEVMKIYCSMNSKTCVSITLIEIDYFLKVPKNNQKQKILEFYNLFKVPIPNNILMNKLSQLLNSLQHLKKIQTIIKGLDISNTITKTSDICNNLI
jgi:hypothetical protein